jgi:hypothetical protein
MAARVSEGGVRHAAALSRGFFVCWPVLVLVGCSSNPMVFSDAAVGADSAMTAADTRQAASPDLSTDLPGDLPIDIPLDLPADQPIAAADVPTARDAPPDVLAAEAAEPDTSSCAGQLPICAGCCGGTTAALCTNGQWECPNLNCSPCGDAGNPVQSCGVGEVVGPGTERCQAAGGVCVRFPDPTCCTFAPILAADDPGCPRAPYAIRCCLLSAVPTDGALLDESGGPAAVHIDAGSSSDSNISGPAIDVSPSVLDAKSLPAEFLPLAGASFTIAASATPANAEALGPGSMIGCKDSDRDAQYRLTFSADGTAVQIVPIAGRDNVMRTGGLSTESSEQLGYWVSPAHSVDDLQIWYNAGVLTARLVVFGFGVTPEWCIQSPLVPG